VTNNICDNADHGIQFQAVRGLIENNTCSSNYNWGIIIDAGSVDVTVRQNDCFSNGSHGIWVAGGSTKVVLQQNNSYSNGGWGALVDASADVQVIENSLTSNNSGGLSVNSTGIEVIENTITMNGGTGIQDTTCDGSSYVCNLVAKNGGDGIVLSASSSTTPPKIYHNTVAYNNADGIRTALSSTTDPYVANCIFWGSGGLDMSGLAYGQYYHCCAWSGISPGNGNLHADPLFVDAPNDDYHMQSVSPCIDKGLNLVVERANDLDGVPRVLDGLWTGALFTDMGTYEYTEVSLDLSGTYQQGTAVDVTVNGPASATFGVYAAVNIGSFPVTAHPSFVYAPYGTVLLDTSKLFSFTPLLAGQLDTNGTATVQLNLPAGSAGRCVVLQTAVDYSGCGQFTETEKFAVVP